MNVSKIKIAFKFIFGGPEAVLDYVMDCANNLADRLPDAKKEDVRGYFETASRTLGTLDAVSWLVPQKWRAAWDATVDAFAALVAALNDMKVTRDELAKVADAFRLAYAAWRAE